MRKLQEQDASTNGILEHGRQHQIYVFFVALIDKPFAICDS
jgi:hypothetical protein